MKWRKPQILNREELKGMSPEQIMDAYRGGALDCMTKAPNLPADDTTAKAIELVDAMDAAFTGDTLLPGLRDLGDSYVQRIVETRKALS